MSDTENKKTTDQIAADLEELRKQVSVTSKVERLEREVIELRASHVSDRRVFVAVATALLIAIGAFWGITKYSEIPAAVKQATGSDVFKDAQAKAEAALNTQKASLISEIQATGIGTQSAIDGRVRTAFEQQSNALREEIRNQESFSRMVAQDLLTVSWALRGLKEKASNNRIADSYELLEQLYSFIPPNNYWRTSDDAIGVRYLRLGLSDPNPDHHNGDHPGGLLPTGAASTTQPAVR